MNVLRRLSLCAAVVGASMALSGAAHAQYFNFTVTGFTPSPVVANGGLTPAATPATTLFGVTNGSDVAVFAGAPFGSDINVATLFPSISDASPATPSFFNGTGTLGGPDMPYSLDLTLTPTDAFGVPLAGAGNAPQTHTFTGGFNGSMSANTSNVTHTFGFASFTYTFASQTFTVLPHLFNNPPTPAGNTPGSISYHVTSSISVTGVPEPGAFSMLLGTGVCGSLFFFRRRRK